MSNPIFNVADVTLDPSPPMFAPTGSAAERFDSEIREIGPRVGAQKLGYNITAVPSGKRAFPFHHHWVNEEMFFVLRGNGEIRIGEATYPIRVGDIVACPAGDHEKAHQIINTGSEELRYLSVSTKFSPEVVGYPDSGKFAMSAEIGSSTDGKQQRLVFVGRENQSLNYWDGE